MAWRGQRWKPSRWKASAQGNLTVSQARRLLGIESRYEMDGFLKAHGVFLDLTLEDVRRDSEAALASAR